MEKSVKLINTKSVIVWLFIACFIYLFLIKIVVTQTNQATLHNQPNCDKINELSVQDQAFCYGKGLDEFVKLDQSKQDLIIEEEGFAKGLSGLLNEKQKETVNFLVDIWTRKTEISRDGKKESIYSLSDKAKNKIWQILNSNQKNLHLKLLVKKDFKDKGKIIDSYKFDKNFKIYQIKEIVE